MKVLDIMQRQIVTVAPTAPIQDVGKIIFGLQIAGVPVVKGKKLLGLITQSDILHKLYPSYQEFMEDYVHAKDFEAMEEITEKILNLTAKDIMNKNVTTVPPDVPIMRVQSLMLTRGFGRVPVVDKKGNLLGIVSQGDIFRAVIGQKLPFDEDEIFHDWFSRHYGLQMDWKARLAKEIPDLKKLFKKEHVKKVLDVGCGLGMHAVALSEEGFEAVGVDRSARMIYTANQRLQALKKPVRERVHFVCHEYESLSRVVGQGFDAAILMGIALLHNQNALKVLKEINKALNKKAIIIIQNANFDKVIKAGRLLDFHIRRSSLTYDEEYAYLRFYDPKEGGFFTYNVAVFARGPKRWAFRGMHSTPVTALDGRKITSLLRKIGFSKISLYGGDGGFYYDYLFRKPFNKDISDQLIIVAKRG